MSSNIDSGSLDDRTASQQDQPNHHDHHPYPNRNGYDPDQQQTYNKNNQDTMSNLSMKYFNLNQVRNMIAQHIPEFIIICVIIIYLVYYFSQISRRPKLIGHSRSKFVEFVNSNLNKTICKRFSPLIYFWGTNPQTALFGYLQGQTSTDEVPRSKFKRQFLYVNDAQYLASNVDLSQHYSIHPKTKKRSANSAGMHNNNRLVQLNATQLLHYETNHQNTRHKIDLSPTLHQKVAEGQLQQQEVPATSLLDQNIRFALSNILNDDSRHHNHVHHRHLDYTGHDGDDEQVSECDVAGSDANTTKLAAETNANEPKDVATKQVDGQHQHSVMMTSKANRKLESSSSCESDQSIDEKRLSSNDFNSSSSGSSSDSGVFASRSHSTTSSASSTSGSSLTIDMPSSVSAMGSSSSKKGLSQKRRGLCESMGEKCACSALYETDLHQYLEPICAAEFNHEPSKAGPQSNQKSATIYINDTNNSSNDHQQQETNQNLRPEALEFGQCALDWYKESHGNYHKNKLVALISAGMTTGSDKKYVTDTVQTLDRLGYEVVVFIRRGVGGLKLSSTRFFSPSKWRDFEAAILSVRKQRPDAQLVSIGFSFGSIELCRYLAMKGSKSLVDAALLVSCPFDPEAGGRNMRKRALNRRIDAYLAKNLGKQLYQALSINSNNTNDSNNNNNNNNNNCQTSEMSSLQRKEFYNLNGSVVDLASLPKIKSLVDFEDNYNRVIQNYPNSDAYAADSRLSEHLANIKTPTLCLSSEDDFMAPIRLLPIEQIKANKNLCMILTKRGGHMAFIDGLLWPKKPYFAQRIISKYMLAIRKSFLSTDQTLVAEKGMKSSATAISIPITSTKSTSTNSQTKRPRAKLTRIANNNSHERISMGTPRDGQHQTVRNHNDHHQRKQNHHHNRKASDNFLNMFDD